MPARIKKDGGLVMSRDDAPCKCNGSGFIVDPEFGNIICDCTFRKAGLGKILPGGVFFIGEPKYVGKMTPSELVPCRPCSHPGCMSHSSHPCEECGRQWAKKRSVHAIAHFDFDGSCGDCACNNEDGGICNLPDTGFNTSDVPKGQRHEHCPLCIEED